MHCHYHGQGWWTIFHQNCLSKVFEKWTVHVRQNNSIYTHTKKKKIQNTIFFGVWKSVSHWILSELIASKKYLPGMLEKACTNQLSVEIRGTYTTCPSKIWINDQHVPSHCKTRISYIEPSLEKVCEHRDLLKIK